MKKLLLTLFAISTVSATFGQVDWAVKSIEFKKMSKKHKMEWFDFSKEWKIKKIDMKKKHKEEWFDFSIAKMNTWSKADLTKAYANQLFKENLMKALEIRKNHMNDYDQYYTKFYTAGQEKHKQHLKDVADFETSIGIKMKADNNNDNNDEDDNNEDDDHSVEDKD